MPTDKKRTMNELRQVKDSVYRTPSPSKRKKNPYIGESIQKMSGETWEEIKCTNVRMFQFGDYPEMIYIIKTGFKDKYLVVREDAYELNLGDTKIMTKAKIERIYGVDL